MKQQLTVMLLLSIIAITTITCKKSNDKNCPLQKYTIACDIKTWDAVFGGYDEGTNTYTIQARCPEDAQRHAKDKSYDWGNVYQHCRVVQ